MGCSPSFVAPAPRVEPLKAQHSHQALLGLYDSTPGLGSPSATLDPPSSCSPWGKSAAAEGMTADPVPGRGPASGLLSCEAASAGSCHSEELLLDDTRVHRRDGAYTGRACGCPWPLAGKCPPTAVMWAEAREALRECPSPPKMTAVPPGSHPHQHHSRVCRGAPWKAQRLSRRCLSSLTLGGLQAFLSRLCSPLSKPPAGGLAALLPPKPESERRWNVRPPGVVTNLVHKAIGSECLCSEVRRFCPALISPGSHLDRGKLCQRLDSVHKKLRPEMFL